MKFYLNKAIGEDGRYCRRMGGIVVFAFLSFVLYSALAWFVVKLMLLQTKQNYKKQRKERKRHNAND